MEMNLGCVGFSVHRRVEGAEKSEAGPVEPRTEWRGHSSCLERQSWGRGKG